MREIGQEQVAEVFHVGDIFVGDDSRGKVFVEVVAIVSALVHAKTLEAVRNDRQSHATFTGTEGELLPVPGAYRDDDARRLYPVGLGAGTLELNDQADASGIAFNWWGDVRGRAGYDY